MIIEIAFIGAGVLIILASLGLLRFGEMRNIIYARLHIAGVIDVACIFLMLIIGQFLIAFVYAILMPLSAHAIANAKYHGRRYHID